MQTPTNPSNTQVRIEATAAGTRRPILTRRIPVRLKIAIIMKEDARRRNEAAFRAIAGCRPSTIPPANAAAIATPGSLMALFAASRAFRCEMSAETGRTDAFLRFHSGYLAP